MKYLILFLFCLFYGKNILAQALELPKEIVYYEAKEAVDEGPHYTVTTTFHPIGWSKDGKFAYAKFFDSYADGLTLVVVVQDVTSDKVIWSKEVYALGEDGEEQNLDHKGLWNKVKNSLEKALITYKISPNQSIDYRKESWHRINGQAYKFALTTNKKIQIDCRAKGLGEKNIYQQKISETDFEYSEIGASVKGIIKSPYEDRVLVLYLISQKGFEFATDESFDLVGCHLTKGFK